MLKACKNLSLFLFNLFFLYVFNISSKIWIIYGGSSVHILKSELILFTIFYIFCSNTKKFKNIAPYKLFTLAPALLFCCVYAFIDIFYRYLDRLPNASDFYEAPALLEVEPILVAITALFFIFLLCCFCILLRIKSKFQKYSFLLVILLFSTGIIKSIL